MQSFLRFSRPHTVIGTTVSITVLYLIARSFSAGTDLQLTFLGWTLLSCLGANIFIVGLNQITDIAIDRINKPYLPLASGAITRRTANWWIGISVVLSLSIAAMLGKYLLITVLLSLLLGTLYSLPPVRLKRFHFWAAFCIIAVRGLIVNLLLFLHFHYRINGSQTIPAIIWLLTGTIFIYGIIIAWFKDLPDIEGDARYDIRTLSIRLGAERVLWIGVVLLTLTYAVLIFYVQWFPFEGQADVFSLAHVGFGLALLILASRVQLSQKVSIARFYQAVWVLFFLEYGLFALSSWL